MIDLRLGDCLEVMRGMDANSVDSIVTDPPYGLEFMGKEWDRLYWTEPNPIIDDKHTIGAFRNRSLPQAFGKDGAAMQAWHYRWAVEALRVAKPGCIMLAFGGTRTHHRLACAIEDAGWEIRDTVMWVYGCLSADTEILTPGGWKTYDTLFDGSMVACYNVDNDSLEWGAVQEVYKHAIEDTVYRLRSDTTDQLVTRDHRCLVERGGKYVFQRAALLDSQETIPILEGVPSLPEAFCLHEQESGTTKQDMLTGVRQQEVCTGQGRQAIGAQGSLAELEVPGLWENSRETRKTSTPEQGHVLQQVLPGEATCGALGPVRLQWQGHEASGQGIGRQSQSRLERWGDLLAETRQLQADQVCEMPSGFPADGPQGRLCDGASPDCSTASGALSQAVRSGASRQPRSSGQRPEESASVCEQQPTQALRGNGTTSPTLATVTAESYKGIVWCVRVPTGAFVARRNGHAFVTGNSGFPKSHDLSKAIDKAAGALGVQSQGANYAGGDYEPRDKAFRSDYGYTYSPATDLARLWQGWGTALKPAVECWWLAMKPLDGTFAQNAEKWGVAGINVDGCRVGTEPITTQGGDKFKGEGILGKYATCEESQHLGRWPANLITDGSEEVVACFPVTKSGKPCGKRNATTGFSTGITPGHCDVTGFGDTGSAARFFYCAKASRAEREMGLEGMEERDARVTGMQADQGMPFRMESGVATNPKAPPIQSANHHPTVKPLALMRYLVRLTKTPTGGLVLDPFMGSGTTGMACVMEGRDFVGIELSEEYCAIARARIAEAAMQGVLL